MRTVFSSTRALVRSSSGILAALFAVCACGDRFSAQSGPDAAGGGSSGQAQAGAASVAGNGGLSAANAGASGQQSAGGAASSGAASGGASTAGGTVGSAGSSVGSAGAGAASECPCAAPTPICVAGKCVVRGPALIKANGFYIDSTEVTNAEYAVFEKAKNGDTSGQVSECVWNTSFDPAFDPTTPNPAENNPVTNVDYCDAVAYCTWAGERLCGKIGGGSLQLAELADATQSQWFEGCAGPKGQLYPYGTSYQAGFCNDAGGAQTLLAVGSEPKCQGYYPNLFDMLGNAQEWVDACNGNAGQSDGCERIGGSYLATTSCGESGLAERDTQAPELGFRCCSQ